MAKTKAHYDDLENKLIKAYLTVTVLVFLHWGGVYRFSITGIIDLGKSTRKHFKQFDKPISPVF